MLFDFGKGQLITMWMKDTYISLDMVFIQADGKVMNIMSNTTPLSLTVIPSIAPVKYVLELNHGEAKAIAHADKLNLNNCHQITSKWQR